MTSPTPSPISDQAAGEPVAERFQQIMSLIVDYGLYRGKYAKDRKEADVDKASKIFGKIGDLLSTAPTAHCTCGEPSTINTVHRIDGPCYLADEHSPAPTTGSALLLDAAKAFYNATIADTSVIVRAPSAEKRDNIKRLGDELRVALLAASMGGGEK